MPIGLVEAGRGCHFRCEFCAVQTMFANTQTRRPLDEVVAEVASIRNDKKLFFFVDDNITSNLAEAKAFFRELASLGIRWVSQSSINAAHDEEFLDLLARSGCQGVLIGFETLESGRARADEQDVQHDARWLRSGAARISAGIGCVSMRPSSSATTPTRRRASSAPPSSRKRTSSTSRPSTTSHHFPGTPLYRRLAAEQRLLFDEWWLDDRYRYNMVPFRPATMEPETLQQHCLQARRDFYGWSSIVRRGVDDVNRSNGFMFRNFFPINSMLRIDTLRRDGFPLGDDSWKGPLLRVH